MMRARAVKAVTAAVAVAAVLVPVASDAGPAPGPGAVEVCSESGVIDVEGIGPRTCHSFDAGSVAFANVCNQLPIPPEACASASDGRVIDPALVDQFEASWTWRALRLQERLDREEPMRNTLLPHTHNSSNTSADSTTVTNLDPNQRYSIGDQMRMGIRGVELDLHWIPHATGTPETGGKAVVLCHGTSQTAGDVTVHIGCTVDKPVREGLAEVRAFVDAAGNEDQFVLLYLENQLEDDPQAHAMAAAAIEDVLGDTVSRPPSPCADMALDQSRQDVLDAGKRVLIVGNCGPGAWGSWVHERGPQWQERGTGGAYPPYPECAGGERVDEDYDAQWIRRWEDLTWISLMVDGERDPLTPEATRSMVQCGVDMIGFDRIEPFDGRLDALVWSWDVDEPVADPARECAARGTGGRFSMRPCDEVRPYSCETPAGDWVVPPDQGPWAEGDATCAAAGATFTVPPTGWENERLGVAAAGADVWIPIGIADVADLAVAGPTDTNAVPSTMADTGGLGRLWVALGLGALAVSVGALVRRRG